MKQLRLFLVMLSMLVAAYPATAQDKVPPAAYAYKQLDDPAQEAKAQALMESLRCLTCQSQSVADSDASMAGDVRNVVRQKIKAGEEPEAVRQWLIDRYGSWISYDPPASGSTLILWLLPLLLLLVAAFVAWQRFSRVGGDGPVVERSDTGLGAPDMDDEGSAPL